MATIGALKALHRTGTFQTVPRHAPFLCLGFLVFCACILMVVIGWIPPPSHLAVSFKSKTKTACTEAEMTDGICGNAAGSILPASQSATSEENRQPRPIPPSCKNLPGISNYTAFCDNLALGDPAHGLSISAGCKRRHGTFVYLVEAEGNPDSFWQNVSQRSDSTVLWLSWRQEVPSDLPQRQRFADCIFYPKSTINRGRNRLLRRAIELEIEQGWEFEFFVFADEDQGTLIVEEPGYTDIVKKTYSGQDRFPPLTAMLNYVLLLHRPARAGVHLQYPDRPKPPFVGCVSTASIDCALEAFHRTALQAMVPYPSKYDDSNAWFSAAVMNIKADILLGRFSVELRQIVSYPYLKDKNSDQKHSNTYARADFEPYRKTLYCFLSLCLSRKASRAARLLHAETAPILEKGIRQREKDPPACLNYPKSVNYATILSRKYVAENWISMVNF